MATKKKTKKIQSRIRTVRLTDKPLSSILIYICDESFVEGRITRVADKKFSGLMYLQRKTKPPK